MSRGLLFLMLFSFILLNACKKERLKEVPDCIQNKITALETSPVRNPPAKVYSYSYNGNTVYYITAYCCDAFSELYNADCSLICHPDGGISGNGDGNCSDFFQSRTDELLIWQDGR